MISNIILVAGQVFMLFLLMAVGFILAKRNTLTPEGVSQMSHLVLYIVSPCIIVSSMAVEKTPEMVVMLGKFALAFLGCIIVATLIATPLFRKEPLFTGRPMRFAVVFGNCGFMGLPLVISILGQQYAILGVVAIGVFNAYLWTYGTFAMGGKVTLKKALFNPATIGLYIGVPIFLTGIWQPTTEHWYLPQPILQATSYMGALNTPLAMVVIGAQMAGTNIKTCFTSLRLYVATAVRLILAPLVTLLVLYPFHLEPVSYCACVILSAAPVAGSTGMFAMRHGQDTITAARLVTLSTLLSIITLPLFAAIAQQVSGF